MKKILIIGAQGYLGSKLGNYLTERKYKCTGIDIALFEKGILYEKINFPLINIDVRKLEKYELKNYDVIIMLAGISNDPFGNFKHEKIYDPVRKYTLKIALICKEYGIQFIFPSSCSVYGVGKGDFNENGHVNPQTPYSLNKCQIEEDLKKISDSNFSPIALRLATIFGLSPIMRFDIVVNMLCGLAVTQNKILLNSNGEAWRPHLHIEDACESFKLCIDWNFHSNNLIILNVGRNDNNFRIIDVANLIMKNLKNCSLEFIYKNKNNNKHSLYQDKKIQDGHDNRNYKVNFDKIHKIFPNYLCKWTLEKGIKNMLSELKKNKFNRDTFVQKKFYRVPYLEHLLKTNQIDDNLNWK